MVKAPSRRPSNALASARLAEERLQGLETRRRRQPCFALDSTIVADYFLAALGQCRSKARLICASSFQARVQDRLIDRPAADIEPSLAIASRSAASPGPNRLPSSNLIWMLSRGIVSLPHPILRLHRVWVLRNRTSGVAVFVAS
jgi:hypothetical protein